jgi:hypothetical protein
LNIRKYEPSDDATPSKQNKLKVFLMKYKYTRWLGKKLFLNKKTTKSFPSYLIAKSDEINIQNHKVWYEKYKDTLCYVSTKMEGQSETILNEPKKNKLGDYKVYGRNTIGSQDMINLAQNIEAEKKLKQAYKDTGHLYAIQGERCAPNVQKGIYKNGEHLYLYTIKDLTDNKLLNYIDFIAFCKKYDFEHVQIVSCAKTLQTIFPTYKAMIDYVEHQWFKVGEENIDRFDDTDLDKGQSYSKPKFHRHEGIVIRGMNNEFSFKVKSNEYQIAGL